ncbi:MAG: heavy metal-binding domain-containing protein [Candidatus Dormibacteraeota bacterium]|uniref:Heavy metal-binding domain-containing protein n=1 Tax=Candidatus Amunia macphersoniae TaxID=3127014 RepID=A0A934NJC3_9BACT|nr:heavy metal-binding domain-containing protein [Candidatus Dormibacteraeota bacterium]
MSDQHTAQQRQQESIASLERGQLPLAARERIDELRQAGAAWTTDLSVAELSAVRHAGFEPVGMVMGSSVYRIAAQWGYANVFGTGMNMTGGALQMYQCPHGFYGAGNEHRPGFNWEHTMYEAGVVGARDAALARITEEARDLDAHGVVGVRLLRRHLEGVGSALEFTVIGTAVRRSGGPRLDRPFMSHLDGLAFSKLVHGGYVPVSLVVGIGAIEIDPGCGTEWLLRSWSNVRIDQFSDGIEAARLLGISRLEAEIASVDADGAVGVEIDFTSHEVSHGATLVELVSIGTAVRRYAKDPLDEAPLPIMRLR